MHVFQPVDPVDIEQGAYTFDGTKFLVTAGSGEYTIEGDAEVLITGVP